MQFLMNKTSSELIDLFTNYKCIAFLYKPFPTIMCEGSDTGERTVVLSRLHRDTFVSMF